VLIGCVLVSFAVQPSDSYRWKDLERYQKTYGEEIYVYCLETYLYDLQLRSCMRRQQRIKNNIIANAIDRIGSYEDAIEIYDECVKYYPVYGVTRIGYCVDTMLILDDKLDDDFAERTIYQKCDEKWRKHGPTSILNCSRNSANFYRMHGEFRD
jgi:hypothetical protein